jgi:5'(3')-deoxyribonucleotidase
MKPILGVDVDLTLVRTDLGWREWLAERHGYVKCAMTNYDFGTYYPYCDDPHEYWRTLDYSQFKPLEGSVEALEALSKYFDIAFISQAKGTHHKNKYYWLKEHFPFNVGVLLTKEKHLMKGSVVGHVDDRLDHLKGFDYDQRILFKTNYTQSVECDVAYSFSEWNDGVVERLCELYL